jgi:nitronate monooxygenase
MTSLKTKFTEQAGVEYPIICGAMYPCSNPELVAAASEAGGLGIVQPISMVYVHGYEFKQGLDYLRTLTSKPYGMNIIVEKSSKIYEKRMQEWVDIALEKGCRFFITALGNPDWVVKKVKAAGGFVYHDVTERKWALKALDHHVDGLICVNNRAGGHAGRLSPEQLWMDLHELGVPLICAGGVGTPADFKKALDIGYAGIQMGTRFIATFECAEKDNYKQAIVKANEEDIVLTERVTGIPLSVIRTPYVEQIGTKVNPLSRWLLQNRWAKPWMRMWYALTSGRRFKQITLHGGSSKDYWQAGKSVAGIQAVEHAQKIIKSFAEYAKEESRSRKPEVSRKTQN